MQTNQIDEESQTNTPCFNCGKGNQSTWLGRVVAIVTVLPLTFMGTGFLTLGAYDQYLASHATNSEDKSRYQSRATEGLVGGGVFLVLAMIIGRYTSHSVCAAFGSAVRGLGYLLPCVGDELERERERERKEFENRLNAQAEADIEQMGARRGR